jgi:hypothetical protein
LGSEGSVVGGVYCASGWVAEDDRLVPGTGGVMPTYLIVPKSLKSWHVDGDEMMVQDRFLTVEKDGRSIFVIAADQLWYAEEETDE